MEGAAIAPVPAVAARVSEKQKQMQTRRAIFN